MTKLKEHLKDISGEVPSYDNEQKTVCSTNVIFYGVVAAGLISVSLLHKNESTRDKVVRATEFILGLGSLAIARNQLLSYGEHNLSTDSTEE